MTERFKETNLKVAAISAASLFLPCSVQEGAGSSTHSPRLWPLAAMVSCFTRTSPQTAQCGPSVRPVSVQVAGTPASTVRRGGACRIGHFFPPGRASNQENQGHKDRNRTDQILFFYVRVPFLLLLNSVFLFTLIDGFVSKKSTASGIFLKKFCLSLFTPAEKAGSTGKQKKQRPEPFRSLSLLF